MITNVTAVSLGGGAWRVTAVSSLGSPSYYWYQDGLLVDVNSLGTRQFDVLPGGLASVEVFDAASDSPVAVGGGRVVVSSQPLPGVTRVRIEKWNGTSWDVVKRAQGSFAHNVSSVLEDGAVEQFQVVAELENGLESRARELDFTMVRNPDRPGVSVSGSGDGITVS